MAQVKPDVMQQSLVKSVWQSTQGLSLLVDFETMFMNFTNICLVEHNISSYIPFVTGLLINYKHEQSVYLKKKTLQECIVYIDHMFFSLWCSLS